MVLHYDSSFLQTDPLVLGGRQWRVAVTSEPWPSRGAPPQTIPAAVLRPIGSTPLERSYNHVAMVPLRHGEQPAAGAKRGLSAAPLRDTHFWAGEVDQVLAPEALVALRALKNLPATASLATDPSVRLWHVITPWANQTSPLTWPRTTPNMTRQLTATKEACRTLIDDMAGHFLSFMPEECADAASSQYCPKGTTASCPSRAALFDMTPTGSKHVISLRHPPWHAPTCLARVSHGLVFSWFAGSGYYVASSDTLLAGVAKQLPELGEARVIYAEEAATIGYARYVKVS